jgi:photosystem II stability/assembly factor-like uncharacterized protein
MRSAAFWPERGGLMRMSRVLAVLVACILIGVPSLSRIGAQTPKFKAIWEPVNYNADLKFFDVHFIDDNTGWVAGGVSELEGGVILYTKDAGRHWEVQYGDSKSSDRAVLALRFLDGKHGWATQDSPLNARLLRTVDGQNWDQVGTIQTHYADFSFTSELSGTYLDAHTIYRTQDGGGKWQPTSQCAVQTEIEGLTKNVECEFSSVNFPSADVGYVAAGSVYLKDLFFIFKTPDGGLTWKPSTVAGSDGAANAITFTDANVGYVRTGYADSGRLFRTTDGGQTWNGAGASPGETIKFTDPQVGWSFNYNKLSFTTSGGTRWTSRTFAFPESPRAFSLPSRTRGYVVGDHGMIYRYSVVPIEYTAKGMIDAPMMPAR